MAGGGEGGGEPSPGKPRPPRGGKRFRSSFPGREKVPGGKRFRSSFPDRKRFRIGKGSGIGKGSAVHFRALPNSFCPSRILLPPPEFPQGVPNSFSSCRVLLARAGFFWPVPHSFSPCRILLARAEFF